METSHTPQDDPLAVVTLLVFLQGAIAVALSAEAIGTTVIFGGVQILAAALTVAATAATLILGSRLKKGKRSTRRWLMAFQVGWLTFATLDTLLAIFLAGRVLTPVAILVRIVLPASIFWLLRRARTQRVVEVEETNQTMDDDWLLEEMLV